MFLDFLKFMELVFWGKGKVDILNTPNIIMSKFIKYTKSYPRYTNSGIPVHRVVAENKIGRSLRSHEVVHHNDGNKNNFRKKNLSVMSRSFHSKLHTVKKRGFW